MLDEQFYIPSIEQLDYLAETDPVRYSQIIEGLELLELQAEREFYENSLIEFFRRAWREIGETAELSINWHHEVIAEHLEAVTYGDLRHLIITIPPRHGKTLLTNVIWPAWIWAQSEILPLAGPQVRFLSVSYSAELAQLIGSKMRLLVMGEWYQRLWGHRVKIREDQQSRAHFINTAGGERMSYSLQGGLLGRGGDIVICDDPHSIAQAESDLERRTAVRAFSEGLMTRITDPRIAARLLVMQRVHEEDCADWALENWPRDTVHLMFPARFEINRCVVQDQRTRDGELLWPQVWTDQELRKIELGLVGLEKGTDPLSSYAVAAQMQQNPHSRGGAIIDRTDWAVYPEEVPHPEDMQMVNGQPVIWLPPVTYVVLVVDTAMSERETADWNACVVWGIWHRRRNMVTQYNQHSQRWAARMDTGDLVSHVFEEDEQPRAMMMEAWRRRGKLNDYRLDFDNKPMGLVQRVIDTARRRKVDKIIIENKTRGKDVADEIKRQTNDEEFQIEMFEPNKHGDKVNRLNSVQPLFSQRLIYAPANCLVKTNPWGQPYVDIEEFQWVDSVRDEVARVPNGKHDDLADCVSSGLIWLRENNFLRLTDEFIKDQLRSRVFQREQSTVAEHYLGAG